MKTLYFDCFAGASGDMTIGALLHLGVDFEVLERELRKLDLGDYELSVQSVSRAQISGVKFDVTINGQLEKPAPLDTSHHHHESTGTHSHDHSHHEHSHIPADHIQATHGQVQADVHAHRTVADIHHLIDNAGLSTWVTQQAKAIFGRLAEAEGKVHGVSPAQVHFHEVGAVDAIIDIVGACIGFELLEIEQFVASPLQVGFGFVKCAHGRYPIPAPGTAELLKGVPIYSLDIEGEFVTPTGAAIVTTLCSHYSRIPNFTPEKIGYGAGGRDFPRFPNMLRLMVGQTEESKSVHPIVHPTARALASSITVLEANIDDMNPQVFGHVMNLLLTQGALDVFYTPVQMKKNRPGTLLTVLCQDHLVKELTGLVLRETTTLGVRSYKVDRQILDRQILTVETEFGPIRMKVAMSNGKVLKAMPEYDDCHRQALEAQVPLMVVQSAALTAFLGMKNEEVVSG
ncbi:MAG: nickel pincer cofactor biosynthesis protein LarC [Acidobacteria bacterium]|nr:nickel pincer cofactor biosynthesis protein LarC [Acidobacteriota bacterium]